MNVLTALLFPQIPDSSFGYSSLLYLWALVVIRLVALLVLTGEGAGHRHGRREWHLHPRGRGFRSAGKQVGPAALEVGVKVG